MTYRAFKRQFQLPVIGLLKAYFQLDDRDDERRIREKLTGRLLTLDPALGLTVPAFLGLLGTLYAKIGRRAQARTDLSAAIALYRDMKMIFWLPQAEAALAEVT